MKGVEDVFVTRKLGRQHRYRIYHTNPRYLDLVRRIYLLIIPILLVVVGMMMIHVDEAVLAVASLLMHLIV